MHAKPYVYTDSGSCRPTLSRRRRRWKAHPFSSSGFPNQENGSIGILRLTRLKEDGLSIIESCRVVTKEDLRQGSPSGDIHDWWEDGVIYGKPDLVIGLQEQSIVWLTLTHMVRRLWVRASRQDRFALPCDELEGPPVVAMTGTRLLVAKMVF